MEKKETPMLLAVKKARQTMNKDLGGPFGAAITDRDGSLIAVSSNRVLSAHDPTAHAEISAIRAACRKLGTHDLTGCTIYATGYPCPMCLGAIIWANIKVCYYGNDPKEAEEIGFRDDYIYDFILGGRKDVSVLRLEQTGHDEAIGLYEEYSEKDKELY